MGISDITIRDVILKNSILYSDKVGLVCGETRWTYKKYSLEVDRLASGLASLGVEKGDRIAVLAFNCHELILLFGAAASMGAIMVPVNWRLKAEEIQTILENCTPNVMVAGAEYVKLAAEISDSCPFVVHRLTTGQTSLEGFRSLSELADSGGDLQSIDLTQDDSFVIIHTAAVKGIPKGAVLTHGNIVMSATQVMTLGCMTCDDVTINILPLFHIGGLGNAFRMMHAGGKNVMMKTFDVPKLVSLIEQEQVTLLQTFPPMLAKVLDESEASGQSLASLRIVSGLEEAKTIQRFQKMTKARFWVGYGQTETTGFCATSPYDARPGSAGKEGPLARVRIVDNHDREVAVGEAGEMVVRGPLVFQKYWNMEAETTHTFRGGWHHSGDMGRLDEEGYLWYVKRMPEKELIKPGGENVYPVEVENVLLEHPSISKACVFGVPDAHWGEAIKAVCVCKEGTPRDQQAVIDFVGERIARYKKPKYIIFVDSLPKNEDGDIDRDKVKSVHGQEKTSV